jgi:hypothetical protein
MILPLVLVMSQFNQFHTLNPMSLPSNLMLSSHLHLSLCRDEAQQ